MNKKARLWLLIFWLVTGYSIVFGWSIRSKLVGGDRAGVFGDAASLLAELPSLMFDLYTERSQDPLRTDNRFLDNNGFMKKGIIGEGVLEDKGYLLLSAYDSLRQQAAVKLIKISNQQVLHEWVPDLEELEEAYNSVEYEGDPFRFNNTMFLPSRFQMLHPLLLKDGGLLFYLTGPLYKIDASSKMEWIKNDFYHHALELDSDDNIWMTTEIYPNSTYYDSLYNAYNDGSSFQMSLYDVILKMSQEGEVLFSKSVTDILKENGYQDIIMGLSKYGYSLIENDPLHINDVQPALYSSEYWEKGDLLMSLRHRSTVFLYRPSTNKILWLKAGPWLTQHDADFVGDSKISIYGNDIIRHIVTSTVTGRYNRNEQISYKTGYNDIYVYDFEDNTITTPYSKMMKEFEVRTVTSGRSEILDNGDVFIEETNFGRLLRLSTDDVKWEYVNTIGNNKVGLVGWSRYLTHDQVKDILPVLERLK